VSKNAEAVSDVLKMNDFFVLIFACSSISLGNRHEWLLHLFFFYTEMVISRHRKNKTELSD